MLQFGVAALTVTGKAIARIYNVAVNITYDTALLRGDNRVFPDKAALYNGNIDGSFENGEIVISAIADMFQGDAAASSVTVTSTQVLQTGIDLEVSCITNGDTGTLTLYNCFFPGLSFTIDRENYTMPTTNFVVAGETSASGGRVWSWTST
jgi:hypothetical protein